MNDKIITKREILASIAIICILMLIGVLIKELFEYGMRTNVGNAFVYGELKAVDPVGYEEISGEYSYIKKVKERYTRHSRTVTRRTGKTTYTTVEYYWTWDKVDEWSKHSTKITFLGVEFDYGAISFPCSSVIDTINESSKIRYIYYGAPAKCTGTLYTELKNNTINGANFHENRTIEETIKSFESNWELILFWIGWIILIVGSVSVFYFIDNRWLEDKRR